MGEARSQILQMLQEGKITAAAANDLLHTLESKNEQAETAAAEVIEGEIIHPPAPPDLERYRRFWQYPFFIALAIFAIMGLWLRALYQSSAGAITFGFICVWSLFIIAFAATAVLFMSRRSAWLHVRVREKSGKRIAISFPLPVSIAGWGLRIARSFVPESEQNKVEMAAQFIDSAQESIRQPDGEPLVVHVDDEDGDQVFVYIG